MINRVATDYLKRKGWIFGLTFLAHMLITMAFWNVKDHMMLIFAMGGSGFLLLFEMMRSGGTGPRTLLALPITSKELGRTWRFVGLEFPIIFYLIALILGALVSLALGFDKHLSLERFFIAAFVQSVLLGTVFFALTGMPANPQAALATPFGWVKQTILGLVYGFSMPASFIIMQMTPNRLSELGAGHWVVALLLFGAAITGWFRTGALVDKRTSRTNRVGSRKQQGTFGKSISGLKATWQGFGGIPYFIFRFGKFSVVIGMMIFLFNTYGMEFFMRMQGRTASPSPENFMQSQFIIPIIALMMSLQFISLLKGIRVMPISRARLTSLLIFSGVIGSVAFGTVATIFLGVFLRATPKWIDLAASVPAIILTMFMIPVFLRFGLRVWSFFLMALLLPFSQFTLFMNSFRSLRWGDDTKLLIFSAITIVGIAILWPLVYRMLGTSHPWRAGALKMPNQSR